MKIKIRKVLLWQLVDVEGIQQLSSKNPIKLFCRKINLQNRDQRYLALGAKNALKVNLIKSVFISQYF